MKRLSLTATLFTLFIAGAHAQTAPKLIRQFPSIDQDIYFELPGKDSLAASERLNKSDGASISLLENAAERVQGIPEKPKPAMPVLQPNASIQFQMLAARPDSTTRYHLQVKKAD